MQADNPARIFFLTNRVGRQLSRLLLDNFSYEGFKPLGTHVGLIADLVYGDGKRQRDLAMSGIKDKATVARSLAQLEAAGMVMRVTGKTDRRSKRTFITEKGLGLWTDLMQRMAEILPPIKQDIDPIKMQHCLEVLGHIYDSIPHDTNSNGRRRIE